MVVKGNDAAAAIAVVACAMVHAGIIFFAAAIEFDEDRSRRRMHVCARCVTQRDETNSERDAF